MVDRRHRGSSLYKREMQQKLKQREANGFPGDIRVRKLCLRPIVRHNVRKENLDGARSHFFREAFRFGELLGIVNTIATVTHIA